MPYKSEKIVIAGTMFDRRRKLTEEQKEQIREIYKSGVCGTRPLAKQFGVSRSTIRVIVLPHVAEKAKQRIKEHWRDYSNRKELTKATRELRRYKQQLYLENKIKLEENENDNKI